MSKSGKKKQAPNAILGKKISYHKERAPVYKDDQCKTRLQKTLKTARIIRLDDFNQLQATSFSY